MTDDELNRFVLMAKQYASLRGYFREAEDFSQYVAEHIIRGRSPFIKTMFIDYLRELYGRYKPDGSRSIRYAVNNPLQLDHMLFSDERIDENHTDLIELPDVKDMSKIEQAIIVLKGHYGFLNSEIATIFGVSEVRISHIIKKIRLKTNLPNDDNE